MSDRVRSLGFLFCAILICFHALLAAYMVYVLVKSEYGSQNAPVISAKDGAYRKLLSDGVELSLQQQRNLMSYCTGMEGMLEAQIQTFQAVSLGIRQMYFALLAYAVFSLTLTAGFMWSISSRPK